ncbi:MAG: hypothetical protein R6X02_15625 [Enhygromyxa sp.]
MSSDPDSQRARAFDSLALFVLAWLWLSLRPEPPLHPDTSRDLAFARDLVDGAELHLHGAWASFAALAQGTAWIDLLAGCQRLGLGIVGVDRVLTTLLAGAVAAAHHGVAQLVSAAGPDPRDRLVARAGPLAGALALLASLPALCEMPILWQPLLLPVPVVFAHLSLWRLLDRGELLDALALGLLTALAFDVHVVAIVLFAGLAFAVPLAAKRPLLATSVSAAAGLGLLLLSSPEALDDNLGRALGHGWTTPGALLFAALGVAGLSLRSRFTRLDLRRRLELAVALEALAVASLVLASRLPSTPALAGRYLLPLAPGLALALALVLSRGGGTRARALVVLGLATLLLASATPSLRARETPEFPLRPVYSQPEFERLADELAAGGHTWTELVVRLQGPARYELLGGLAALIDPGDLPAPEVEAGLLVVALAPRSVEAVRAELPASTRVVALAQASVLLVETPARLDRAEPLVCTEAGECSSTRVAVNRRVDQAHPKAWIGGRSVSEWLRERSEGPVERVRWQFPVRPGPATLLILPPYDAPRCAWRVIEAEGFELGEPLPAAVIELPPDAAGTLSFARTVIDDDFECRSRLELPPAPIELDLAWTRLRSLLLSLLLDAQGGERVGSG